MKRKTSHRCRSKSENNRERMPMIGSRGGDGQPEGRSRSISRESRSSGSSPPDGTDRGCLSENDFCRSGGVKLDHEELSNRDSLRVSNGIGRNRSISSSLSSKSGTVPDSPCEHNGNLSSHNVQMTSISGDSSSSPGNGDDSPSKKVAVNQPDVHGADTDRKAAVLAGVATPECLTDQERSLLLDQAVQDIRDAEFVALDLEFTGLFRYREEEGIEQQRATTAAAASSSGCCTCGGAALLTSSTPLPAGHSEDSNSKIPSKSHSGSSNTSNTNGGSSTRKNHMRRPRSLTSYYAVCVEGAEYFLAPQLGICTAKRAVNHNKASGTLNAAAAASCPSASGACSAVASGTTKASVDSPINNNSSGDESQVCCDWVLSPYTFYAYPSERKQGGIDTSTLRWLLQQGIDLNYWVAHGFDYARLSDLQKQQQQHQQQRQMLQGSFDFLSPNATSTSTGQKTPCTTNSFQSASQKQEQPGGFVLSCVEPAAATVAIATTAATTACALAPPSNAPAAAGSVSSSTTSTGSTTAAAVAVAAAAMEARDDFLGKSNSHKILQEKSGGFSSSNNGTSSSALHASSTSIIAPGSSDSAAIDSDFAVKDSSASAATRVAGNNSTSSPIGANVVAPLVSNFTSSDGNLFSLLGAVGLQRVIEAVIEYEKPIVVHNGHLDLLHILDKFVCTVPKQLSDFCRETCRLFTGGIYDTKHLANEGKVLVFRMGDTRGTSLGYLREHLLGSGSPCVFSISAHRKAAFDLSYQQLNCERAPECNRMHEAGFDALLTAQAFVLELDIYARHYSLMENKGTAVFVDSSSSNEHTKDGNSCVVPETEESLFLSKPKKKKKKRQKAVPLSVPWDWQTHRWYEKFKNRVEVAGIRPGHIDLTKPQTYEKECQQPQ